MYINILPSELNVFTEARYLSEEMALPEVIWNHVKKETDHKNIYIIDRGLQSTRTMKNFSENKIAFVIRSKENRKYIEKENLYVS